MSTTTIFILGCATGAAIYGLVITIYAVFTTRRRWKNHQRAMDQLEHKIEKAKIEAATEAYFEILKQKVEKRTRNAKTPKNGTIQ